MYVFKILEIRLPVKYFDSSNRTIVEQWRKLLLYTHRKIYYQIFVYLDESIGGSLIPSMTIRGAAIPADVEVRLHAKLGPGKTPVIMVKVK
jgi:hypothetical protein